MDTTTSSLGGADDEREEDDDDDDEDEEEKELDAELEALSNKHNLFSFEAGAMSSAHPNTPTSCCSPSNATPQPPVPQKAVVATAEELEERDAFQSAPPSHHQQQQQQQQQKQQSQLQQPRSLPYHRPVPVLHHFSLTPPPRSLSVSGPPGHKCASPTLLPHHFLHHHHHHHHHYPSRPLPSPQTPCQPHSLQIPPPSVLYAEGASAPASAPAIPVEKPLGKNVASLASGGTSANMSRSISDSTLRRAALHLNLSQSVLPSFTTLQQFKVCCFEYSIVEIRGRDDETVES